MKIRERRYLGGGGEYRYEPHSGVFFFGRRLMVAGCCYSRPRFVIRIRRTDDESPPPRNGFFVYLFRLRRQRAYRTVPPAPGEGGILHTAENLSVSCYFRALGYTDSRRRSSSTYKSAQFNAIIFCRLARKTSSKSVFLNFLPWRLPFSIF